MEIVDDEGNVVDVVFVEPSEEPKKEVEKSRGLTPRSTLRTGTQDA